MVLTGEPLECRAVVGTELCMGPRWPAGPLASRGAAGAEALSPSSASSPRPPTTRPSLTWQRGRAGKPGVRPLPRSPALSGARGGPG